MKAKIKTLIQQAKAKGWSVYAIARAAGIDPAGLQRFLSEDRQLKSDSIDALFDFFEVETSDGKVPEFEPGRGTHRKRLEKLQKKKPKKKATRKKKKPPS